MPRFMVELTFPDGLDIPMTPEGSNACGQVVDNNAKDDVTWVHSYVSPDKTKTFRIYDGPNEQAIQSSAERNGVPVDRITEVRGLDPYFYH